MRDIINTKNVICIENVLHITQFRFVVIVQRNFFVADDCACFTHLSIKCVPFRQLSVKIFFAVSFCILLLFNVASDKFCVYCIRSLYTCGRQVSSSPNQNAYQFFRLFIALFVSFHSCCNVPMSTTSGRSSTETTTTYFVVVSIQCHFLYLCRLMFTFFYQLSKLQAMFAFVCVPMTLIFFSLLRCDSIVQKKIFRSSVYLLFVIIVVLSMLFAIVWLVLIISNNVKPQFTGKFHSLPYSNGVQCLFIS